jgi:hypothetical protein
MRLSVLQQLVANLPPESKFYFRDTKKREDSISLEVTLGLVVDIDGSELAVSGLPKKDY